jgi:hypothetical protein
MNGNYNDQISSEIKIGVDNTIACFSYIKDGEKKTDGNDIYFVTINDRNGLMLNFFRSTYVSDEMYEITFSITSSLTYEIAAYASTPY